MLKKQNKKSYEWHFKDSQENVNIGGTLYMRARLVMSDTFAIPWLVACIHGIL